MNHSPPRTRKPRAQRTRAPRAVRRAARPAAQTPARPVAADLEIELKFAISPTHGAHLGSLPLVRAAMQGRARTRALHSIYYDTPDCALKREGIALRLRKSGRGWMQTIKGAEIAQAGLAQRREHNTRLPAPIINLPALIVPGVSHVLDDPAIVRALRPVFVSDFKRTLRNVALPSGALVELAYDRGALASGDARAAVSEIELELKAGDALDLIQFAEQLARALPLRLEPRSKAQRGYELAANYQPTPVKAVAPALTPQMSVGDAYRAVVMSCIAQLQANEQGIIDDADPEYLHQARVALRRLRTALSLFSRAFPKYSIAQQVEELRWLDRCLGPARDWDVLTLQTLPQIATALPGDADLHVLVERAARIRAETARVACDALCSSRYTVALLQMLAAFQRQPWLGIVDAQANGWREQPLSAFAQALLSRRHAKVRKVGGAHVELDATGLHLLRIQIKKLRYAAEFFSALFARKGVRDYTRALAALQDLLGRMNDAVSADRLCESLRAPAGEPDCTEALGLVRGWAAATLHAQLARLPECWAAFRDTACFWE